MTTSRPGAKALPDWWQRENQRWLSRLLILLLLVFILILYYIYIWYSGITGIIGGIPFDTSNSIAFVRQEKDGNTALYMIHADGTDLKRLTPADDTSDKLSPSWTIDGKQLLYASNRDDRKKMQIYIRGGNETKQLTYGTGRKEGPIASPDGNHIAFLTLGAVKEVRTNGKEVDQVLPPPRQGGNESADQTAPAEGQQFDGPFISAAYSHDGLGLAAVQELSSENNFNDPVLKDLVGGDQIAQILPGNSPKALPLEMGNAVSVAWDPAGNRLLCTYAESHKTQDGKSFLVSGITLYSFTNPGHPEAKPLLISVGMGIAPHSIAWSPDGKRIAFEAWRIKAEKSRELVGIAIMDLPQQPVVFDANDADKFPPTLDGKAEGGTPRMPRWSPDGSRLLYQVTRPDNKNDLWVINSDLTNRLNLTKGLGDNTQAAWSPARPK